MASGCVKVVFGPAIQNWNLRKGWITIFPKANLESATLRFASRNALQDVELQNSFSHLAFSVGERYGVRIPSRQRKKIYKKYAVVEESNPVTFPVGIYYLRQFSLKPSRSVTVCKNLSALYPKIYFRGGLSR